MRIERPPARLAPLGCSMTGTECGYVSSASSNGVALSCCSDIVLEGFESLSLAGVDVLFAARPPAGSPGSHFPTRTSQRLSRLFLPSASCCFIRLPLRLHALCPPAALPSRRNVRVAASAPALSRHQITYLILDFAVDQREPASWREAIGARPPSIAAIAS